MRADRTSVPPADPANCPANDGNLDGFDGDTIRSLLTDGVTDSTNVASARASSSLTVR